MKHCERPDLLEGFVRGMAAVLSILDQHDEDKIVGAAAFHRKGISNLAGVKRQGWTDEQCSRYLTLPDENWIVK